MNRNRIGIDGVRASYQRREHAGSRGWMRVPVPRLTKLPGTTGSKDPDEIPWLQYADCAIQVQTRLTTR